MTELDFARIFQALPSPFMILDRELCYVAANPAYEAVVGTPFAQLQGQNLFSLFPNEGEAGVRLRQSFERVLATGEPDTLAYINYPITEADGTVTNRYWTAVHVPLTGPDGTVQHVMQNTVDVTELVRMREATTLPYGSISAATRLIERTRETEASSAEFRRLFQQAPAFVAVLSGPNHVFTFTSDSYTKLIGGRDVIGQTVAQALPEVIDQGFIEVLDKVYREGHVHAAEGARVMLENEPGRPAEETFLDFSYNPIRDGAGNITGVFVQGMDRTESVRAVRRQRLMIDELNHRVKNTLATVQSIASQTLRNTSDFAQARRALEARIMALSNAHTMLSDRHWRDAEVGNLVHQELSAFGDEQVDYGGPTLMVNAKTTVALALVLHEMAANAARHGALSVPEGNLSVKWRRDGEGQLVVDWVERNGPTPTEPVRQGFGARLLRMVVTGELGGGLDLNYDQDGLRAQVLIPAAAYAEQEARFD
ncbi:PAS domain S-box-containing protein [Devosia subaequoris]|uniref:Blue-light-activated histidine kinase n=1 Tax=Devosia subaequoris TaxID=395930 RepID=A0A7W6ILA0_9HYPH|nr:HWE histidine kinase domain-containing protein [Devosia subaequoris]MBB4051649.1 PAS domain S-box-containing protein [Devosia subaequoris]MCP1209236.1 PAS domain-containing protein [Devosia subaequoris]